MRHVAPHRWADMRTGKVSAAEAATMASHAEDCVRCAMARARIAAAQAAFADIRNEAPPEVRWDRVRAQVYWQTSSQLRLERLDRPRRTSLATSFAVPLASLTAVAALVAAVASGSVPRKRAAERSFAAAPAPTADLREIGVLTLVRGDATVDGQRAVAAFSHPLGAASEIRTGSGDVSVQFGDGSAFAVGPRSILRLRQFDRHSIALEIDGRVDVDVAPRAPGQRFVVIAGSRTIEVRGTGFRVERIGDAIAVGCRHGRVAVKDDAGELEVASGESVEVAPGVSVDSVRVRDLATSELAELTAATPHRLAVWASPDAVTALTAALTVATSVDRGVRVDGAEVGRGPLTVRVVAGRHLVETEVDGAWVSAGWVDVRGGPIEVAAAPPEVAVESIKQLDPPRPDPAIGRSIRRQQLGKQLKAVRHCVRGATKQGLDLDDRFVEIELSVDSDGAVRFANVIDSDLPVQMSKCVRDAVVAMHFPPGPAAAWTETVKP